MTTNLLTLHRAYVEMSSITRRRMSRIGFPQLPQTRLLILLYVAEDVTQASALAQRFGISRQAVAQHLDAMEREGIIARFPIPGDRRVARITLTERGAELAAAALHEATEAV